ncbi:dual oxidase 2 [Aplysia californica]|uniref:NAD(P)H oxidase (H2O2-forming) n=1 Tax=Aplysia californica TaxID=6500 RepID=A0ABM1A7W0_APLCA|nr:dual oxidase 2 [Aplysia californica]
MAGVSGPLTFAVIFGVLCVRQGGAQHEYERHPNDGWFNNLLHPDWGAIDTHLLRRSPTNYSDGVYEPSGPNRPNPLDISKIAFHGKDGLQSDRSRNALLVFFGQQLVEEIMDAQRPGCPREFFNIRVPKGHKYNPSNKDDLEMPFLRARYDQRTGLSPNNPRQQLNEITPYIDGNLIYGAGKAVEDALREFKGGRLLATDRDIKKSFPVQNDIRLPFANPPSPRDHVLRPVNRFRRYGNPRTHENPFLTAFAIILFRYHNKVAADIEAANSSLTDEEIFNAARKRTIAQYQKTVMYEWLPPWLSINITGSPFNIDEYPYVGGKKNPYAGYDPNVHPGISTEFQAAALRFGHTLVPSGVKTMAVRAAACKISTRSVKGRFTTNNTGENVQVEGVRLCNAYWVPEEALEVEPGLDDVVRGMIFTTAAKEDNIIVSDIRENVFGPLDWSRRDLGALNIQRGRDLGLPSYNDVRVAYGLHRRINWTDVSPDYPEVLRKLSVLYGSSPDKEPDDLDLFTGGLLETNANGPGQLFRRITLDQFLRIRHGDRFWYENRQNRLFSDEEIAEIQSTTFTDVIDQVTDVFKDDIATPKPINVFLCYNSGQPPACKCTNFDPDETSTVQETCEPLRHYDYFSGSEASFLATVIIIILSIPATIGMMMLIAKRRKTALNQAGPRPATRVAHGKDFFIATEWVGRSPTGALVSRDVKIQTNTQRMKVLVSNPRGQVFRMIDLRTSGSAESGQHKALVTRSRDKNNRLLMLAVPGEIDLVLHFTSQGERDDAFAKFRQFFKEQGWTFNEGPSMDEHIMWREAFTIDQRREVLTRFFKSILDALSGDADADGTSTDQTVEEDVLQTKLTRTEFADALGLQPHSLFVRNMFLLVDVTGDGRVSFHEFKTYFGILSSGSADEKAEIFFKMFDTSRQGKLSRDNYKKMILSLLELQETPDQGNVDIDNMVNTVFAQLGKGKNDYLTFKDFKSIMFSESDDVWKSAVLDLAVAGETLPAPRGPARRQTVKNRAQSFFRNYSQSVRRPSSRPGSRASVALPLQPRTKQESVTKSQKLYQKFTRYVDNHRREIFWLVLYTLVTLGIFVERAHYYSFEREHAGLRRLAGYGVSITRGAASAQMFTYASLLVTMSRNTLTYFRETVLQRIIPFDSAHDMHIYIAALAMLFTVMHIIGHLFNFYHISTQASLDLNCYFREYFRATHELASFHYWTYQTVTGLTGVALTLVLLVMYVFASPYARRHVFLYFSTTHNLYIVVYFLMFLHGAARLVQVPLWPYFFLGPMVLFLLDKLVSVSRNRVLLPVHKVTLLPSGVTNLVFKRPLTFNYQSGQWVRIACPALGAGEYHPFTLTSAPHEESLSLHIRAVGPWTTNLRRIFDPNTANRLGYPKIYVDGPFGESHQDWFRYKVAVLIGGGIGVTPFASILKDIAYRSKEVGRFTCDKVYFLWVTRTQKSFEWMTDIIRQVELADVDDYVDVQICITQMKEKFDLRTTMLYMCERYFQKIAGLSMFTGLKAKTHFGRPKFHDFFGALKDTHSDVSQIGVFSCGPPAMTRNIQLACTEINAYTGPSLIHHFENF